MSFLYYSWGADIGFPVWGREGTFCSLGSCGEGAWANCPQTSFASGACIGREPLASLPPLSFSWPFLLCCAQLLVQGSGLEPHRPLPLSFCSPAEVSRAEQQPLSAQLSSVEGKRPEQQQQQRLLPPLLPPPESFVCPPFTPDLLGLELPCPAAWQPREQLRRFSWSLLFLPPRRALSQEGLCFLCPGNILRNGEGPPPPLSDL